MFRCHGIRTLKLDDVPQGHGEGGLRCESHSYSSAFSPSTILNPECNFAVPTWHLCSPISCADRRVRFYQPRPLLPLDTVVRFSLGTSGRTCSPSVAHHDSHTYTQPTRGGTPKPTPVLSLSPYNQCFRTCYCRWFSTDDFYFYLFWSAHKSILLYTLG